MIFNLPDKLVFKQKEVLNLTRLDSKVIDYWEEEFRIFKPVISKNGEKFYTKNDLVLILKIKELLIEKKMKKREVKKILSEYTLSDGAPGINSAGKKSSNGSDINLDKIRDGLNEILTLLDKDDKK